MPNPWMSYITQSIMVSFTFRALGPRFQYCVDSTRVMLHLFELIKLAIGTLAQFFLLAIAKAFLLRVPPSNWRNIDSPPQCARFHTASLRNDGTWHCQKPEASPMYQEIDSPCIVQTEIPRVSVGSVEVTMAEGVSVVLEISGKLVDHTAHVIQTEPGDSTLCSADSFADFSIYSDVSSPNLNKAMLISPSTTMLDLIDPNLSLLKAASERVSEILRENRRRLDAGEDPNVARKEARRKRGQELSAVRNARGSPF